jgi:hypothetical protein
MGNTDVQTIMPIHVPGSTPIAGKGFETCYEAKGRTVIAPCWRLDDFLPPELRLPEPRSRQSRPQRDDQPL